MQRLIKGYYSVADEELFRLLAGMVRVLCDREYLEHIGINPARLANGTHLA